MNKLLEQDCNITDIVIAVFVKEGFGETLHNNRQSHGLAFNLGKKKTYFFDGQNKITLGQNEIIFMPKGSNYQVSSEISGNCYAVNFDISDNACYEPFVFKPKNTSLVLRKFKSLEAAWTKKGKTHMMDCKALLYELISYMQNEYELEYLPKSTKHLITPAIDFIHENYTSREIKVPELAELCGVSEDYLRKIFAKAYNTSPLKYAKDLKLTHSAELIISGMYSISEAAQLSGYSDMSYFSREFKKHFGISPAEYKKKRNIT